MVLEKIFFRKSLFFSCRKGQTYGKLLDQSETRQSRLFYFEYGQVSPPSGRINNYARDWKGLGRNGAKWGTHLIPHIYNIYI